MGKGRSLDFAYGDKFTLRLVLMAYMLIWGQTKLIQN